MNDLDFLKSDKPVKVILDTDLGNDVDDVLAMALLYRLEQLGECEILGITVNKANILGPRGADALNNFYGRGSIPVGWIGPEGPAADDGPYLNPLLDLGIKRSYVNDDFPGAVSLVRKILAESEDAEVVIISIGFLSNLAALLQSAADKYSQLCGAELVKKKVRFLSIMAGNFSDEARAKPDSKFREYNVRCDVESSVTVMESWPTPTVYCGFELGKRICYPASSIENDFGSDGKHPLPVCYGSFAKMPHDRPCWDLVSSLFAVSGTETPFSVAGPGKIKVFPEGHHDYVCSPDALNYYLTASDEDCAEAVKIFVDLVKPGS